MIDLLSHIDRIAALAELKAVPLFPDCCWFSHADVIQAPFTHSDNVSETLLKSICLLFTTLIVSACPSQFFEGE